MREFSDPKNVPIVLYVGPLRERTVSFKSVFAKTYGLNVSYDCNVNSILSLIQGFFTVVSILRRCCIVFPKLNTLLLCSVHLCPSQHRLQRISPLLQHLYAFSKLHFSGPQEQNRLSMSIFVAERSIEAVTPAVLDFIRLSLLDFDSIGLQRLASRLEHACVSNPELAMATDENPQQSTDFRDEVLRMSLLARVRCRDVALVAKCDKDFGKWVKSIEGRPLDDDVIYNKLRSSLPAPGGARDEDALALGTGRILARLSYDRIKTYSCNTIGNVDLEPAIRLKSIISKASESCVFSKIGNQFLFQHFRAKLNPERCALLMFTDTPFRHVAAQFDEDCNDVTRPVIDRLCGEQFKEVDWDNSRSAIDFILAASILREIVDQPIGLLVNTEASFAETMPEMQLFALNSNFQPLPGDVAYGTIHGNKMQCTTGRYSVFTTLYEFICRRASDNPNTSFGKLLECCEADVDSVPSINPFKKFLN